jgi:hypothetical protein
MRLYSTAAALFVSFVSLAAAAEDQGYSFRCSETPSVQDWAAELDKIQPVNPVFGGTLIVSLPPKPAAGDARGACLQAMYEARIEAIRRTEIFDQVTVSYDDIAGARPVLPPRTFGVWVEHDGLIAGYADAMRQSTMTAQPLDLWATQTLRGVLKAARAGSNPSSTDIAATGVGPTKYFGYKGHEYISYGDLRSAFAANEKDYAGGIRPAQPVGKRLLVVIPPEQTLVARLTEHFREGDPSGSFGKVAGSSAYFAHLGQADAVRKSGLFREIAVEEKDVEEVPAGSYDAVLWIKDGAYDWTLSVGGHPAIQFASPAGADPEQMVLAVTDAYVKAQSTSP